MQHAQVGRKRRPETHIQRIKRLDAAIDRLEPEYPYDPLDYRWTAYSNMRDALLQYAADETFGPFMRSLCTHHGITFDRPTDRLPLVAPLMEQLEQVRPKSDATIAAWQLADSYARRVIDREQLDRELDALGYTVQIDEIHP
jgi:hypothetical protein